MTETVTERLYACFGQFNRELARAGGSFDRLTELWAGGFGTEHSVLLALDLCDGVRRVNFWPEHTVTVWMTWDPRPTWEQVRAVRDVLKTVVPVHTRTRVMAVPLSPKYGPPVWHRYIPLTERYQRDIDRLMIGG